VRRLASLIAPLLFAGCAWPPEQWHEPRECRVREEIVDAYLDRVVNLAIEKMSTVALAQYEQATLAFEIGGDGSVSNISVMSASHPVAAEAAREALRAAAPYPRPPPGLSACLLTGRAVVGLYSSGRCDEPAADLYIDAMAEAILAAALKEGIAAKYDGDVILRIELARDGTVESAIAQRADAEAAGIAVAATARALKRFDPPHELIQDCVARGPILLWIPLSEL